MSRSAYLFAATLLAGFALPSCAVEDSDRKPLGPVSDSRQIPWNAPQPGQGQGQLGMLPQNQFRR